MYQAPFCALISRSIGVRVCSTVRASVSKRAVGGQRMKIRDRPPDIAGDD